MRANSVLSAFLFALTLLFLGATPASAEPNAPGNNGTIKIHESPGDREPVMANDPKVCLFHIHGFNFDNGSKGEAWIVSWAPTGNGSEVWRGSWIANGIGVWLTADIRLGNGHYKAYAKQTDEATPGGNKQKVFWVECGQPSGTSGTTAGGTTSGTTTGESTTTTTTTTTTGGGSSGGNVSTGGSASATTTGGVTASTAGRVAGNQNTPAGVAAGAEGTAQGPQAVLGVESLPSTSTDTGAPLIMLVGMGFLATGLFLTRRSAVRA